MADTIAPPGGMRAGAGPWLATRHRRQHRLHAAICRGRPENRRRTGGRRSLAQPSAIGARGLAITNNLNFGNPEKPTSWRSSRSPFSAWAMPHAPRYAGRFGQRLALQRDRRAAILPCPVIGMVGTIDDVGIRYWHGAGSRRSALVVIGQSPDVDDGWLGVSLYARNMAGALTRAAAGRSGSRTQERPVRSAADCRRPHQRGA